MVAKGWVGRLSVILLAAALLAACGAPPATTVSPAPSGTVSASASTIAVVATTSVIADLVRNVSGERVRVAVLLPPGTDPHTYTPTPRDVQAIANSQIVFSNGLGLEAWLDEITANAGGKRPNIVVSNGLTPIAGGEHAAEAATGVAGGADQAHANTNDPHMWFDVQNAIGYVDNIRKGLQQVDPAGASTYEANATAYTAQLKAFDTQIRASVATLPAERRKLITNHDTFGYFARRYGFTIVGSVFEGVSTEQEPSAQQIAQLVAHIRAEHVPAIFTENTVNTRLADQVADEAGVKVVTSLYTDALGEPGSAGDTYLKMMRFDVQQIVDALK